MTEQRTQRVNIDFSSNLFNEENMLNVFNKHPKKNLYISISIEQLWNLPKVLKCVQKNIIEREGGTFFSVFSKDFTWVYGDTSKGVPVGTPYYRGVAEILWDTFGGVTRQGVKIIEWNVGVFYKIPPTTEEAKIIDEKLKEKWIKV
jgi:hypothetical protein